MSILGKANRYLGAGSDEGEEEEDDEDFGGRAPTILQRDDDDAVSEGSNVETLDELRFLLLTNHRRAHIADWRLDAASVCSNTTSAELPPRATAATGKER